MEKLVLIDGNSLLNRAYYATPLFTTKNGVPTNAVFGFTKLLFKILDDVKPEYILVAFDMKAPTFRHKMYKEYKATRKGMPDDLAVQVEPLKELLKAMNIAMCGIEGIEADDILGTLSKKFPVHSYLYTGDRDSYQLVDENTEVCYTKRGVSDLLHLNKDNFKEVVGLVPSQIVDLKALMGDKSDNIPGIPGIGEKTAYDLLLKYGDVEGIYNNLNNLKDSLREKFENGKEIVRLSYELAKINRNCDIDIELESCRTPEKYGLGVKKMFADFEFKSFLGLDIYEESEESPVSAIKYPPKIDCGNFDEIKNVIVANKKFSVVLEAERADIYVDGKEYVIKISDNLLDEGLQETDFNDALNLIFGNKENTVVAYEYKDILHILDKNGIKACCMFEDLSIAKYLCDYSASGFDLKELCEYYLYDFSYAAFAVSELFGKYYKNLVDENIPELYNEIEKPLLLILFEMERQGVKVSVDRLAELSEHYRRLADEYKTAVFEKCGEEFNINSPAKLAEILYEKIGIKEVKKKKTGKFSTSADILEKLVPQYPVVDDILKFRMYQKLLSTYVEGFKPLIKEFDLVHTTFHQTLTATGRLSSSNPNLQNIPVREDEGRELRKVFVPREGNIFIDADYSQIELRLLAHLSECKELVEAYNNGTDIHAVTASQVFGVPIAEVTPRMRREAKAVNFGIIYGISEFGLSQNLNIPIATAKEYIEKYFETYSAVKDFMSANVEFARKNGYVATITGRKRVIPEINSPNYNIRQFGERAAMNMPLQGSSADIIKIAMINVCKKLEERGLKTKLILQVHDELLLEAPEAEAEEAEYILKHEMENAVKLKVPLTVDVHTGKNWYDAK